MRLGLVVSIGLVLGLMSSGSALARGPAEPGSPAGPLLSEGNRVAVAEGSDGLVDSAPTSSAQYRARGADPRAPTLESLLGEWSFHVQVVEIALPDDWSGTQKVTYDSAADGSASLTYDASVHLTHESPGGICGSWTEKTMGSGSGTGILEPGAGGFDPDVFGLDQEQAWISLTAYPQSTFPNTVDTVWSDCPPAHQDVDQYPRVVAIFLRDSLQELCLKPVGTVVHESYSDDGAYSFDFFNLKISYWATKKRNEPDDTRDCDGDGVSEQNDQCPTVPAPGTSTGCVETCASSVALTGDWKPGTTTLRLAASVTPASADNLRFRWAFGDGTTAVTRSPNISHRYAVSGPVRVTVRVVSPASPSCRAVTDSIRRRVPFRPVPVIDVVREEVDFDSHEVVLDGSRSFDVDGGPVLARWLAPDGSYLPGTRLRLEVFRETVPIEKPLYITRVLDVVDDEGVVATETYTLEVTNPFQSALDDLAARFRYSDNAELPATGLFLQTLNLICSATKSPRNSCEPQRDADGYRGGLWAGEWIYNVFQVYTVESNRTPAQAVQEAVGSSELVAVAVRAWCATQMFSPYPPVRLLCGLTDEDDFAVLWAGSLHFLHELEPAFEEATKRALRGVSESEVTDVLQIIRDEHSGLFRYAVLPGFDALHAEGLLSRFAREVSQQVVPRVAECRREAGFRSVIAKKYGSDFADQILDEPSSLCRAVNRLFRSLT